MRQTREPILNRNRNRRKVHRGFTLLESLIAVCVLVIGIVAISRAFSSGMLSSTDAENVDLALNMAQAKMEQIRDTAFGSIVSSGPTADTNFPNFNTTVTVTGTDPKQIVVQVAWNVQGPATSTNVTLTTYRANY